MRLPALVALAAFGAAATAPAYGAGTCPPPPFRPNPATIAVAAPHATLQLRIATTNVTREYGLMCVRALPPGGGMVFVFPHDELEAFWMKNTLIPLDMIWVHGDGRVGTVASRVPATTVDTPEERLPRRDGIGMYVIELAAGEAARAGITVGTRLDLSRLPVARE